MSYLTLKPQKDLLAILPGPKNVWEFFLMCTEIPRGSYNTKMIADKLMEVGKGLGCECYKDEAGNVLLSHPGSPGCENKPCVCLQAHMDMVTQKRDEAKIDMLKEPITPRIVGDKIMATDTSLGADNGIGIGMALGILNEKDIKHPPIEILITNDEEVGLLGAFSLKPGLLKSKLLINVDSEEEKALCFGCAGGFVTHIKFPYKAIEADKQLTLLNLNFTGCFGGHSGVDIHIGRCNAVVQFSRILKSAFAKQGFFLKSFNGGSAHNAIPRSCVAQVLVPKDKVEEFKVAANEILAKVAYEYKKTDENMTLLIKEEKATDFKCLDKDTSIKFLDFLNILPRGVVRMSPDVKDLVETSGIVAVVTQKENEFDILLSGRSSSESQLDHFFDYLHSIASISNSVIEKPQSRYPGWEPDMKNPLLIIMTEKFTEVYGEKPELYAIHAGLECGLIQSKYPGIQCLSIGPQINNPHSPDEEMVIDSVERVYKSLLLTIAEMAK